VNLKGSAASRLAGLPPIRRPLQILTAAAVGFNRNGTGDQAAALAYISLVSLVPLAAAFSVLLSTFFGGDAGLAEALSRTLPYRSAALTQNLHSLIAQTRSASGLGTALFFAVAFRAFVRIESSINRVWRIQRPRRMKRRIGSFLLMMFWGPAVLGLLFNLRLVFGASAEWTEVEKIRGLGSGAAFIATALAFTMIHWRGPNAPVRIIPALGGGLAAAVGTKLIRITLAHRWSFLSDLNVVYGSLAILVLFLFGLFAFWGWFLFTVELTHAWQRSGRIPARHFGALPPPEEDGELAIRLGRAVAHAFRSGEPPRSSDKWADVLDLSPDDLERVARLLEVAGLLEVDPGSGGLRPGRPPEQTTLAELWSAVAPAREIEGPGSEELAEIAQTRLALLAERNLDGERISRNPGCAPPPPSL